MVLSAIEQTPKPSPWGKVLAHFATAPIGVLWVVKFSCLTCINGLLRYNFTFRIVKTFT